MLQELIVSFGTFITNISKRLRSYQQNDLNSGIVNRSIFVDTSFNSFQGPFVIDSKIILPEIFLNFQWCICYYFLNLTELYSEKNGKVSYPELKLELHKGTECFYWALSLLKNNTQWPSNIENPNNNNTITSIVNIIFMNSLAFIFFHEYGHIKLGHEKYIDEYLSKTQETEADNFSLNLVFTELANQEDKENFIIGSICAGLGLLFASRYMPNIKSKTHPDVDIRMSSIYSYFSLEKSNIKQYTEHLLIFGIKLFLIINDIGCKSRDSFVNTNVELDYLFTLLEEIKTT